jgi:Septum formation initiator
MIRKQPVRVNIGWLFLAVVVVVTMYILASGSIKHERESLGLKESGQRLALSRLETERTALEKEIGLAGTDPYIENLARTQYGFLKPGEIRFEITNPEALYSDAEQAVLNIIQQ